MARSGRWVAARLGKGTITNINTTATRRVFAVLDATVTNGASVEFTQGVTKMSAIDGAWVMPWATAIDIGSGSIVWHVHKNSSGGTLIVDPSDNFTSTSTMAIRVLAIGTPDINSIV